jgi:hypothetical protein
VIRETEESIRRGDQAIDDEVGDVAEDLNIDLHKGSTVTEQILYAPDPGFLVSLQSPLVHHRNMRRIEHFLADLERYSKAVDMLYSRTLYLSNIAFNDLLSWEMFDNVPIPMTAVLSHRIHTIAVSLFIL